MRRLRPGVIYKGTVPELPDAFELDGHHLIERGKVFTVCGNTWRMLADTRFSPHFDFIGDFGTHYGIFPGVKWGQGERMKFDLTRRLAAEALGTFFLVMAVVGSGIMAEKLADGNEAIALLCNTLPTGAVLFVIITIFVSVSGAQFNPAVTLVMLLRGEIKGGAALAYVAVQIAGGCLGAVAAHLMFGLDPVQLGSTARTGVGQWIGEFIATFGLIAAILGCVRFRPDALALAVGLYITSAYWFTSSTSFANPAVTVARALSDTFAGIAPGDAPGFIVAQLIGAVAAAYLFGWLFAPADTPKVKTHKVK